MRSQTRRDTREARGSGWLPHGVLALILVLSFVFRLWPISTYHWWDEAIYLQHAELIYSGAEGYNEFELRPPVLPILFAAGYLVVHHVYTATFIVVFLSTMPVLFIYLLGRDLYDWRAGLIAAGLYGFSPYMITASHWIMSSLPGVAFLTVAFYLAVMAEHRDRPRLLAFSGILFAIAALTRFTILAVAFVVPLYLLTRRAKLRSHVIWASGFALTMTPYFVWSHVAYGHFLQTFRYATSAVAIVDAGPLFYIENWLEMFSVVTVIGAVAGIVRAVARRERWMDKIRRPETTFVLWIVVFLIYISTTPHKEVRYLFPLVLPVFLLAGCGFAALMARREAFFKSFGSVCLAFFLVQSLARTLPSFAGPFIIRDPTPAVRVSRFLSDTTEKTAVVYANHDYPVYAFYSDRQVVRIPQSEDFYQTFPESMPELGYLVHYQGVLKEPTRSWLEASDAFMLVTTIAGIDVYRYTPR